jgi:hypothetical protein
VQALPDDAENAEYVSIDALMADATGEGVEATQH